MPPPRLSGRPCTRSPTGRRSSTGTPSCARRRAGGINGRVRMTTTVESGRSERERQAGNDRLIVVSCDSHVGPRMKEDLRQYCPASFLEQYDEWASGQKSTFKT